MRRISLTIAAILILAGCSQQSSNNPANIGAAPSATGGGGLLSSLRPHADPSMVEKVKEEEAQQAENQRKQLDEAMKAQQQQTQNTWGAMNTSGNVLPSVSQAPFAPPADQAAAGSMQQQPAAQPAANPFPFWPFGGQQQAPAAPPPQVATYPGGYGSPYGGGAVPPPPPGASPLVPPPPAVSVTGVMNPYGAQQPAVDPYGNPYGANPYANPYAQQQAAQPLHAPGSPFGTGGKVGSDNGSDDGSAKKKNVNFVPITPTGMDARSAYKQRDDLKVLWKGALTSSPLQRVIDKDEKVAAEIGKVDVGLPGEATKGSLSATQRQIDAVFKPVPLDKKVAGQVKQLESDVVQAYQRYLYSYNKFALLKQTVAARKQEVDVAGSAAEQQRAAADLSQAQSDADAARDDMHAAEQDLSGKAGPQAARVIIGRVSGVTPSADTLAVADTQQPVAEDNSAGGGHGGILGFMGLGKGAKKEKEAKASPPMPDAGKSAAAPEGKKGKKVKIAAAGTGDLAPAPDAGQSSQPAASAQQVANQAPAASDPISFELKKVDVTPRKSILKVSIHNHGDASFNFNPDNVSITEGNRKLSDENVRAEFDTTLVAPNQEVTGTITIFGHPWNDRLSVALSSDGGHSINLKR